MGIERKRVKERERERAREIESRTRRRKQRTNVISFHGMYISIYIRIFESPHTQTAQRGYEEED